MTQDASSSNEASALAEIVQWSQAIPLWQRDALRRLGLKGELDVADIDALKAICKGDADVVATPIDQSHVRDSAASTMTVYLNKVHELRHVNALAEGEQLTFDKIGLTVIYGDNGAGKSGYARVLKKACRARTSPGETIHQNIYANKNGRPTAVLEFSVNGANHSETWVLGKASDPSLSAVSVFDSRSANVHVDQTNDLAYTPLPLKLLRMLAQACQEIKDHLTKEVKRLKEQTPAAIATPQCQPGTQVGKLIKSLPWASVTREQVEALAVMTPENISRLATLKSDLAVDPGRVGRQLQATKTRLDIAIDRIEKLALAVADIRIDSLRANYLSFMTARAASQAASTTLFSGEALPDIGSDAWRVLWHAARDYSEQGAYREQAFPVVGNGAHCVLCLQELSSEAAQRLTRFEAFIKNESKRRETDARTVYEASLSAIRIAMPCAERTAIVTLVRDELDDANTAEEIRRSVVAALWRSRHVIRSHQAETEPSRPPTVTPSLAALRTLSINLQTRATALLSEAGSPAYKQLVAERDELADCEWLISLKEDVLAEVDRRQEIAALEKAAKDTTTHRITTKSAELAEKLVTNALRAQFAQEVSRIGVAGLAIELRQAKTAQGVPLFRVCLIKRPDAKVGDVLSEGEYRCVALAAFLAELATADGQSAIVFDDPVSSLDHMHREAVANRLAHEGEQRQIIVLTHDIAFLFLLAEACRERGTHIAYRSINRGADATGFCQPKPPPNAQPVDKVIESLQKQLTDKTIHYTRGNQEEWYLAVRSLLEQLRTTWERSVEDALSPVIKRLANKIDTKGLPKLTVLTLEDCRTMREAFGRCSELLHSVAASLNPPLPKPDVIEDEITALGDWISDLRQRQDKVKAHT